MQWLKIISALSLAAATSVFCACFSLGVVDMDEYNTRFPSVYAVKQDLSSTVKSMSDFVGDDEMNSEVDMSELSAVVDVSAYRAIAVKASSGNDNEYPTSTIGEIALYFYYEGTDEVSLDYGIFVSTSLPEDAKDSYTFTDITGSSESDLYTDGQIVSKLSADSMLFNGSLTLANGWSSIYATFESKPVLNSGEYLTIVFFDNNDYQVTVTEHEKEEDDGQGNITITYTYDYTFELYETNDIAFSFDKVLFYVSE